MPTAVAALLARGYLPKELPPPFTSASLGPVADAGFPADFDLVLKPTKTTPAFVTLPAIHNLARAGTLRRKLSVPNPVNQIQIAREIIGGWKEISKLCRSSTISLTTPRYSKVARTRAILPHHPFSALPGARAKTRAGSRYILETDLNSFYPSIYTHSIPWALHTKAQAKKLKQDYKLLGNRLDLAIRNGQGQQTIGIPIGPDTSLVIAEILASAVDKGLPAFVQKNAYRFIDDFECGFMGVGEAEDALARIQNEYSEYELNLNPRKTRIVELPEPPEALWVPHIRNFPIIERPNSKSQIGRQHTEILSFFGRAFELAKANREEAILKYAISRMRSVRVHADHWPLYENLLLGCLSVESGTTSGVVSELLRYRASHPLNLPRIKMAFERLIQFHAPQHHGSEVAWSIWFLAHGAIQLSGEAGQVSLAIGDPVVTLCLLHARSLGLIGAGMNWATAEMLMTTDELHGPNWLLAYEASVKGWLASYGVPDHIALSSQFAHLRASGVTFFDSTATMHPLPAKQPELKVSASVSVFTEADLSDDLDDEEPDEDDDDWFDPNVSG